MADALRRRGNQLAGADDDRMALTRFVDLHGKPSLLGLLGYLILAGAVVLSLWATERNANSIANERAARSVELNGYLERRCLRDTRKDAVYIGILQDSIKGVRARRDLDPAVVHAYVTKQQANISAIRRINRLCTSDIPPPIPKHNT